MPAFTPDLDAYCERIGYSGPRQPDLATLRALHLHHVAAVPFENLDVLLGRRISLDPAVIADKIILRRRGGYCFEQNTLFREILTALGFRVTPLLARVRWQVPAETATPLTHTILRVEAEGRPWLVDVGFGAVGTTGPLALDSTEPQATPHELRRLIPDGDSLVHQVRHGDAWGDVYRFSLTPPPAVDFEVGNWFSCTHPRAHFTNNLVVTRVRDAERLVVFNHEFTVRDADGTAARQDIRSPHDLRDLLIQEFGLHLSSDARLNIPAAPW